MEFGKSRHTNQKGRHAEIHQGFWSGAISMQTTNRVFLFRRSFKPIRRINALLHWRLTPILILENRISDLTTQRSESNLWSAALYFACESDQELEHWTLGLNDIFRTDLVLLHAPSVYDFRSETIIQGPIADAVPFTDEYLCYQHFFFILFSI